MKESELRREQVFRPPSARSLAVVWFALAAFVAFDAVRRGSGRSMWIGLAVVALVSALVHALAYRPAVVADDSGITLRNIVRDVVIPWSRVEHIGAKWSLTVEAAGTTWASWAITARNRQRSAVLQMGLGGAGLLGGGRASRLRVGDPRPEALPVADEAQSPAKGGEYVSAELSRRWEEAVTEGRADAADEVTVRWAWPVVASLAASALALVIALAA